MFHILPEINVQIIQKLDSVSLTILLMVCKKSKSYVEKMPRTNPKKSRFIDLAAKYGYSELVIWSRSNNYAWSVMTCAEAAKGGHLYIIQWARENDCPWDERTCE